MLNRRVDEQDARLLFDADTLEAAAQEGLRGSLGNGPPGTTELLISESEPGNQVTLSHDLHTVDAERYQIARRSAVTFVQQERTDTQPVAHVLYRGLYDQMTR